MKNKGFTLIEIIAVIVIMGILLVVVFAGTSRLMKSNDEKKYTTYYDIVHEGLEKYARTRRNEVGGSQGSGCFDDKKLEDLISMGYVKEFTEEDNVYCGTPRDFASIPASWGIDTSKQYASLRVEGENGNITTKLSLICVEVNSNGTYASEPTYVNLIEAGPNCTPNSVVPDDPEPPTPPPGPSTTYYTITYNANGGSSCTKTSDSLTTGQSVDLTPTCTRSGYTFFGWSKTTNGTVLSSLVVQDSNITLYAKWVSNSGGGSGQPCNWLRYFETVEENELGPVCGREHGIAITNEHDGKHGIIKQDVYVNIDGIDSNWNRFTGYEVVCYGISTTGYQIPPANQFREGQNTILDNYRNYEGHLYITVGKCDSSFSTYANHKEHVYVDKTPPECVATKIRKQQPNGSYLCYLEYHGTDDYAFDYLYQNGVRFSNNFNENVSCGSNEATLRAYASKYYVKDKAGNQSTCRYVP